MSEMYVGIDIGGTNIKYGILNDLGEITEKGLISTKHNKKELILDLVTIIKAYQQHYIVEGVGISAPGIIEKNGFMLTGGAIKELYGVNLQEEIQKKTKLPVKVENDANAAAIAESWIGNAVGIDNYLCVVLGTGVGGGIVINGEVYRGAHGMAGEFGYMMTHALDLSQNIEEASLNWNSAVIGGLCRQYNQALFAKNPNADPCYNANKIMELAAAQDPTAKKTMTQYYQDVAVGMINLIGAFDPAVLLIGGGISDNDLFMFQLKETIDDLETRHESIAYLKGKTIAPIKPAKLKNDAGLIGAVYQVKKSLEK